MKESEIENKVSKMLNDFERMELNVSSAEFSTKISTRISTEGRGASSKIKWSRQTIFSIVILSVNIGLFISAGMYGRKHTEIRKNELNVISKELLINPMSASY